MKLFRKNLPYFTIALGMLFAVPVALSLFYIVELPFNLMITFHILSSSIASIGFYSLTAVKEKNEKRGNVWWIYASILCFTAPLYGIISAVGIYAIQKVRGRRPPPVVSDEITVRPPEVFRKAPKRSRQLEVLERLDIEPFIDIFRSGKTELKRSAVKFLGSIRSRTAIRMLNEGIMDKDIEVRLFAAGILGLIEDDFAQEIDIKKKRYMSSGRDRTRGLDLASYYSTYAESGLLDSIGRTYYYEETTRLLAELPDDPEVNFIKARSLYKLEEYDEAQETIKKSLMAKPTDDRYNELFFEILFAKRDYVTLQDRIQKMSEEENMKDEISIFSE